MRERKALITGITGQDGPYLASFFLKKITRSTGLSVALIRLIFFPTIILILASGKTPTSNQTLSPIRDTNYGVRFPMTHKNPILTMFSLEVRVAFVFNLVVNLRLLPLGRHEPIRCDRLLAYNNLLRISRHSKQEQIHRIPQTSTL